MSSKKEIKKRAIKARREFQATMDDIYRECGETGHTYDETKGLFWVCKYCGKLLD